MVTIHSIKKEAGVAGQVSYTATVEYEGEGRGRVTFIGSSYGGPVVMRTHREADLMHDAGSREVFVTDPGRFGEFGPEWVRRFFA